MLLQKFRSLRSSTSNSVWLEITFIQRFIWFSKCTSTKVSALINSVKTCWHLPSFFQKAFVEISFLDKKLSWHHVHLKNSPLKCRFGNKLVAGRESKYLTNEMLLKVCRVTFTTLTSTQDCFPMFFKIGNLLSHL